MRLNGGRAKGRNNASKSRVKGIGIINWLDKMTFTNILITWISTIVVFGVIYFLFADSVNYLYYNPKRVPATGLPDAIYFSFVTATTTGFGDIVPFGMFKWMAVIEVLSGLMLLAVVTSKLVSIKQNVILDEIYEMSFKDKISSLRSSLLAFRQNMSRIMSRIEEGTFRKREVGDIQIYISPLEDTMSDIIALTSKHEENRVTKIIDPVNAELLFGSVISSFEKLGEALWFMNQKRVEWKREATLNIINRCMELNEKMFGSFASVSLLRKKAESLRSKNGKAVELIKGEIENAHARSAQSLRKYMKVHA